MPTFTRAKSPALAKAGISPAQPSRASMEGGIILPCPEPGSDPMSDMAMTSTGHMASGASWLDAHFESARPEYEEALRFVGIQPGWSVLDAGCGAGGYVPLLGEPSEPRGGSARSIWRPRTSPMSSASSERRTARPPWICASAACWTCPSPTLRSTACGAPTSRLI